VQRRDGVDTFTYAQLERLAAQVATWLAARGIPRGDRCAILGDNDALWEAAYLGIVRLGAIAVPLDTNYKAGQIATLLRDCGARVIFTGARFLRAVEEGVTQAGGAAEIVLLHGATPGRVDWQQITSAPPAELPPCPAEREDPAVILYSSGTTGDPKGVVLTHANLFAEIDAAFQVVHIDERDAILGVLPLFHALAQMANIMLPFARGTKVVFLESLNSTELLRALQERHITAFVCVPQFFYLIHQRVQQQVAAAGWVKRKLFRLLLVSNGALRAVGINLGKQLFGRVHAVLGPRMRYLVTGGSRFDPAIGRDLYRMGFQILQAYGLTEVSGAATIMRPNDSAIESVGLPLPGVEVRIRPPEKPAGEEQQQDGEILIRGGIVMQGYYNRPDANAAVLRDGWFYSGDLGYLDSAGRLYITGRSKEIIVLSSGKNIYPEEIEAHYLQSPYIKELCVLGRARPNEPSAERLHAVVVPDMDVMRERKVLNMKEILRYEIEGLSIGLPSHKRVLSYDVWTEELPRTTTRKLRRYEIERRVKERTAAVEESSSASAAPAILSEEDQLWAADPHVRRALEVVADAASNKNRLHPAANIELELGLDSMERVELLTHLQQMFGVTVPDEVAHKIYTVRELVEAVRPREGSGATAGASGGDAWARILSDTPQDDPVLAELVRPKPLVAPVMFVLLKLCALAARALLGFRTRGLQHLPATGPYLLCPNHQSYLDAFLLVAALPYRAMRQTFFVGAKEYFESPLMAWFARQINLVPVDPDTNLLRAMQAGAFGLRAGKVLILFPEGERSIDGAVKKFKKGAAILSLHLNAPIVPVALDGAYDVWPRGRGLRWSSFIPRFIGGSGASMTLRFGAPLPPPAAMPPAATFSQAEAHYSAAAEQLRSTVLEMWQAIRHPA
jgi:long-chain acyl-CoA synthetase